MGYRIGIISTRNSAYWGGNEELWYQTALEAKAQGHEVFVSVCDFRENSFRISVLRNAGAQVYLRPFNRNAFLRFKRRLSLMAYKFNMDLFDPFASVLNKKLDFILVAQAGTFEVFNNIHLAGFLRKKNTAIMVNSQYLAEHVILPEKQFRKVRELMPLIGLFAFVSNRNLLNFERMISSDLSNKTVIQNPVKTKVFAFAEWPDSETLQFAVVGRLACADKGQDVLLQIFGSESWKNRNWHLNIYGRGTDESYLKELVKFYQIEKQVSFCGYESDITMIWKKNHVLLLPSFAEGTPLVLMEAMSCGRAAVVSDVGGNAEFVVDGKTGIIAEAPSAHSFGKALEKIWERKTELNQMGKNALDFAKQRIDLAPEKKLLSAMIAVFETKQKAMAV